MHPRDQWFRIYVYTPGKAGPVLEGPEPEEGEPDTRKVVAKWIEPPTWELESDIEHVHHPDAYHPDPRVRIKHHRTVVRMGVAVAACGHVHDPRTRVVETNGKPAKPCNGCLKATKAAVAEHEKALDDLQNAAIAKLEARAEAVRAELAARPDE
jgi:hypothetical protein